VEAIKLLERNRSHPTPKWIPGNVRELGDTPRP
jgi:hypothetical protein